MKSIYLFMAYPAATLRKGQAQVLRNRFVYLQLDTVTSEDRMARRESYRREGKLIGQQGG